MVRSRVDDAIGLWRKAFRDTEFEAFHSTIISMENYVDEYEKEGFIIMIFKIPESNLEYYQTIMAGKYSELPSPAKTKILKKPCEPHRPESPELL